ncbi:MAG: hypothetical protein IPG23_05690 [Burkholderiales bacterium]|nr:hypothetical protein [Burkholderiales bacterium]
MESSENTALTRSQFWQQVNRSTERLGFAALLGFAVLVIALYGGAFQHGWAYDDSQILKHAAKYSPWEYFFIPAAWKALVPFYLTPWLSLAYDVDLSLFGLNPWGFYGHNLLVLAGCGAALFLLLRRWLTDGLAMMTSVLMLLGTPMATASQQLMVRHYTEGLLFFLVGLLCFLRSLKASDTVGRWMVAGALCFCIAVFSKELFVPLGLLPLVMPADKFSMRWKRWWPWAVIFVLYWPWRTYMLGSAIGGGHPP